jgi:hypothetical protein
MRFRSSIVYACITILIVICLPYLSSADPLDNWHVRNAVSPHVQDNGFSGMTYGNGTFVAVGAYGTILTSEDGISWTVRKLSNGSISEITYGKGFFVGVGDGFFASKDGINWKEGYTNYGMRGSAGSVAYGNGTFVAVGYGSILTSKDGSFWTYQHSPAWQTIDGVVFGNGIFVALVSAQKMVLISSDGKTWTWQYVPEINGKWAIAYGNNTFVAAGVNDCDMSGCYAGIMTSSDGVHWTVQDIGIKGDLRGITYGNNTFVAVGRPGMVITSHDGIHWTPQQAGIGSGLWAVTYGNGTFVAGGEGGVMLSSPNGANWTVRSLVPGTLFRIAYGNNTYVAMGGPSSDITFDFFTSSNGVSWDSHYSGFPFGSPDVLYLGFSDMTYINGQFIATGDHGILATSSDGVVWDPKISGTTALLGGAAYGNNTYVVVGSEGTVLTSPDGTNWSSTSLDPAIDINTVIFAQNTFLALGNRYETIPNCVFDPCPSWPYGNILSSNDGVVWTKKEFAHPLLNGAAYGNGIFVVLDYYGSVFTSTDASTWVSTIVEGAQWLSEVTYGNGTFTAVGHSCSGMVCTGQIFTSHNGVDWKSRISGDIKPLYGVAYINNTFVAVGESGTILQSDPLSGNCTATLSSDLMLHVPIINFNGTYLQGDATCQSDADGSIICRVINYGVANPQDFAGCQASTLTSDLRLQVPAGIYKNISYEAEFESVPSTDGQMWFKLVGAIKN